MSTLSAILNTLTHIARDTTARLLPRNLGDEVLFFRLTTLAIGITTTIPALKPPEMLITLFGVTTSIISTVLVGPIIYGLFWRKASALGALVSMITSFAVAIAVSAYGGFRFPWTYYAFIPSIILSLTLLPLISIAIPSKNTAEHHC
jgi:Na+/pantothenate symporter